MWQIKAFVQYIHFPFHKIHVLQQTAVQTTATASDRKRRRSALRVAPKRESEAILLLMRAAIGIESLNA